MFPGAKSEGGAGPKTDAAAALEADVAVALLGSDLAQGKSCLPWKT